MDNERDSIGKNINVFNDISSNNKKSNIPFLKQKLVSTDLGHFILVIDQAQFNHIVLQYKLYISHQ